MIDVILPTCMFPLSVVYMTVPDVSVCRCIQSIYKVNLGPIASVCFFTVS